MLVERVEDAVVEFVPDLRTAPGSNEVPEPEFAADLPERRDEVVDVDDVSLRPLDGDAVTDLVGLFHHDVRPAEEAEKRLLECE